MSTYLTQAIVQIAEQSGDHGVTMGEVVDALVGSGFAQDQVERELWELMGRRRLTPCGFVRRTLRRKNDAGELEDIRVYEYLLIPWSQELDQQLELDLG